jgi:hypothetical protein
VTRTLAATTAVLPFETQALLGPLVETIDGQAEELTGSLLGPAASGLGETVGALTGALTPSEGPVPGSSAWGGGTGAGYPPGAEDAPVLAGAPARADAIRGLPPTADRGTAFAAPPYPAGPPALPNAASEGARPAGEAGSVGAPPAPSLPTAPTFGSALGSSSGPSAAFAVLAGLFALALAAFLGRLLPWSDTIRPLAFVSPPERPG